MPQIHQKVYNSTHSEPGGLSSTSFNAKFRLGNFKLFTMYHYPWFKGLGQLFPIFSMHQISQNSLTLLSDSPYASTSLLDTYFKVADFGPLVVYSFPLFRGCG